MQDCVRHDSIPRLWAFTEAPKMNGAAYDHFSMAGSPLFSEGAAGFHGNSKRGARRTMKTLNSNQSQRPTRGNRVPASLIAAGFLAALSVVCPAAAQSPSAPLLTITEPAFNSTVQNATGPVTIQLLRAADAPTLQAQINGSDISNRFTRRRRRGGSDQI
jgi:hypothetical protein